MKLEFLSQKLDQPYLDLKVPSPIQSNSKSPPLKSDQKEEEREELNEDNSDDVATSPLPNAKPADDVTNNAPAAPELATIKVTTCALPLYYIDVIEAATGKKIGILRGMIIKEDDGNYFNIDHIQMDPDKQGKGYGSSAMKQYMEQLDDYLPKHVQNFKGYYATTHILTPAPKRFFEKAGFTSLPKDDPFYQNLVDEWHLNTSISIIMVRPAKGNA